MMEVLRREVVGRERKEHFFGSAQCTLGIVTSQGHEHGVTGSNDRQCVQAADDPAASERVRVRSRQLVCESEESLRSATEPASSDVGLDRSLHGKRVDEVCTIASSESFPQMARREEVAEPEVEHDGALGRAPERVQPEQHIGRDLRTLAQPEPRAAHHGQHGNSDTIVVGLDQAIVPRRAHAQEAGVAQVTHVVASVEADPRCLQDGVRAHRTASRGDELEQPPRIGRQCGEARCDHVRHRRAATLLG